MFFVRKCKAVSSGETKTKLEERERVWEVERESLGWKQRELRVFLCSVNGSLHDGREMGGLARYVSLS